MPDAVAAVLVQRVRMTHGWMLKITEDLTDEQMAWRISQIGPPPIGWHLWHMSRWADLLQASFVSKRPGASQRADPNQGIWETERLVTQWDLQADLLGLLESGILMEKPAASLLPEVGKDRLLDYARRTFAGVDQALADLDTSQFYERRKSIMALQFVGGSAIPGPGADTTVAGDVGYHLSHASRHLGMMEVIRGMQGLRGTATI